MLSFVRFLMPSDGVVRWFFFNVGRIRQTGCSSFSVVKLIILWMSIANVSLLSVRAQDPSFKAVNPEVLIFDEPFSALDPLIRREMQDELLRLQKLVKKTMVFITHDFLEAIKMGDHIAIMKDGETSQIGTPEELVAEPADDYVREFTEDVPRYKVLSVAKIMQPPENVTLSDNTTTVKPDDKLEALIDLVSSSNGPLGVVDDSGELVGEINQAMVLKAMNSRS